jgi:uroporphyrinogen decarboxylase
VDILWPIERASEVGPVEWRRRFGRDLLLMGGVDKRVLPRGPKAMREHLLELAPLIEEGGFIPTIDHTVPPDVSFAQWQDYLEAKTHLLAGEFGKLG